MEGKRVIRRFLTNQGFLFFTVFILFCLYYLCGLLRLPVAAAFELPPEFTWEIPAKGYSIAVDGKGNIYVPDIDNHCIQKLSPDGVLLAESGSSGSGGEQIDNPRGIAVDGSGNVYVSAFRNSTYSGTGDNGATHPLEIKRIPIIQKFSPEGVFLTKLGSYGAGDGQLHEPAGIAVDRSGNVYVVDSGNYRIQKFSSEGAFLTKWGKFGKAVKTSELDTSELEDGNFCDPRGIAVDESGNVYVADNGNNRIQKFSSDGGFLAKWGSYGVGDGQFFYPEGIAVDESGNVYVADTRNHRIQKFSSEGVFLTKWGTYGSEAGQFHNPEGIAVDKSGNIYVADTGNNRIQKFSYPGTLVIEGSRGRTGNELLVPVMLHYVPAPVFAFGFLLTYDANVLEYAGFESGDLVQSFQSFDLRPVEPGKITAKGNATEGGGSIPKEARGCVVRLKFKVIGGVKGECYPLTAGSMLGDLAGFTPVDGSFCLDYCDGDLNGDGAVTPQDALTAFECFLTPSGSCLECVDINDDGEITPQDALCIFRRYLGTHSCLD